MHRIGDESEKSPAAIGLDHPDLTALEAYWRSIGTKGAIPSRTDLNPAQIESVLPHAFVLQRVAPGIARFRVAGQRIHDLLRIDPRGMPFSTLFQTDQHDELRHLVESAFRDPAIVGLPLRSEGSLLRPALDGAVLLLPMHDAAGELTRLLGALVTGDHIATKPRRFAIRQDRRSRLDRLAAPHPTLVHLAPDQPHLTMAPDRASRPALRLVVNNG